MEKHALTMLHVLFSIDPRINYRHVAILDDVLTTGFTANAISRQLRKQGVRTIEVWCAAHPIIAH